MTTELNYKTKISFDIKINMLDLEIAYDYEESDCESVDLEIDYTKILKNSRKNKFKQHNSFKKQTMIKSFTDYKIERKDISMKTKLKNIFEKIKRSVSV